MQTLHANIPKIRLRVTEVAVVCNLHPYQTMDHQFLAEIAIRSGFPKALIDPTHRSKPFISLDMAQHALRQDNKLDICRAPAGALQISITRRYYRIQISTSWLFSGNPLARMHTT